MAALRIFTRVDLAAILNPGRSLCHVVTGSRAIAPVAAAQIQCRWGSYKSSAIYTKPEDYTDYEISKDPNEWKYIERLLPHKTVPKPPTGNVNLPSGWKPPSASPTDYPYFINRTRNHMYPLYLDITHRGMRKITEVHKIQGDIWQLERELKDHVQQCIKKKVATRIYEFTGTLKFRGDHVSCIKEWLSMKGF